MRESADACEDIDDAALMRPADSRHREQFRSGRAFPANSPVRFGSRCGFAIAFVNTEIRLSIGNQTAAKERLSA